MDISDFLTDEELVQAKTLVGEELLRQRRFKAEESFEGDRFDVCPIPYDFKRDKEGLPGLLGDFVGEMHCIRFDKMLPESRRLLWYCTLLAHKLSKSDFPYPDKLEKLDHPENPEIDISTSIEPPEQLSGPDVSKEIQRLVRPWPVTVLLVLSVLSVGLNTIMSLRISALIHREDRSSFERNGFFRNEGHSALRILPPPPLHREDGSPSDTVRSGVPPVSCCPGDEAPGSSRSPE